MAFELLGCNRAKGLVTICNSGLAMELEIPSRFGDIRQRTHGEAVLEIDRLARILATGADALRGLYLKICDMIRSHELTDEEIRSVLGRHFPPPRVSEFVKIANAPPEVYRRYYAGFIGFRAALAECRGYRRHTTKELHRKKVRRAAERLITLLGQGEVVVCGKRVIVSA